MILQVIIMAILSVWEEIHLKYYIFLCIMYERLYLLLIIENQINIKSYIILHNKRLQWFQGRLVEWPDVIINKSKFLLFYFFILPLQLLAFSLGQYLLYQFTRADVTNYQKLGGSKQYEFILSQLQRLEVQTQGFTRAIVSLRFWVETSVSLPSFWWWLPVLC